MPNIFKLHTKDGSAIPSSTETTVYTTPLDTTTVVVGLSLANLSTDTIFVDVLVSNNDGDEVHYVKNAPIPTGSTIEIMSGNKIVLEQGDSVKVISSEDNSLDTILSVMEQT